MSLINKHAHRIQELSLNYEDIWLLGSPCINLRHLKCIGEEFNVLKSGTVPASLSSALDIARQNPNLRSLQVGTYWDSHGLYLSTLIPSFQGLLQLTKLELTTADQEICFLDSDDLSWRLFDPSLLALALANLPPNLEELQIWYSTAGSDPGLDIDPFTPPQIEPSTLLLPSKPLAIRKFHFCCCNPYNDTCNFTDL